MLAQKQRDRIQRVFGEQLRAADDDGDKSERVDHVGDEFVPRHISQGSHGGSDTNAGQPHGESSGNSGKRQRMGRATQLLVRAVLDLLEDLLCGPPQGVGAGCHS